MAGAVTPEELSEAERRLLRQLRADGAPFAIIPDGSGCKMHRIAARLRERGVVDLWPGRGWYLTDAGFALREQLLENA